MFSRRSFLQRSGLVALAPTVPTFLAQSCSAASAEKDATILVVIQLDGGNDGINTVVPYSDEGYAKHREALKLKTDDLVKLNDELALHSRMGRLGKLFEDGQLEIINGVGYPNPNRSHFRSMAIWQSASFDEEDHDGPGWLGDVLSHRQEKRSGPDTIYVGTDELPVALRGRRCVAASVANENDLSLRLPELGENAAGLNGDTEDLPSFLNQSVLQAYSTANQLSETTSGAVSDSPYPGFSLAQKLKLISKLIKSGASSRVYYTSQGGYDTHAIQLATHGNLIAELSSSLSAFMKDLTSSKIADRVVVMAFSEFGRRVKENGSLGTDHGTAGPVFLAGSKIKSGLHGKYPKLLDLSNGDLKHSIDFRQVYVSILDHWLKLPRPKSLSKFEALPILSSA